MSAPETAISPDATGTDRRSIPERGGVSTPELSAPIYSSFENIIAVAPNLHWHYTGITSTIISAVSCQAAHIPIVATGPFLPREVPQRGLLSIIMQGWRPPNGSSHRIWHARRNNEMIVGLFLKHVFRQPWKLVFTSAAQRHHSSLSRWLLRHMDALIATSEGAAAMLEHPSRLIPHGVDTNRFSPDESMASLWRQSGLPGHFGIGVFGRIRPQKGTDVFVEAMIQVLPRHPGATAVLSGRVARRNAKFVQKLKQRIAAAGLSNRFVFLGEQPSSALPGLFRSMRLYVAPMRSEGFGLTPLEAMASATPVIATRVGAAEYLVADGETGLLVPPDDLATLVQAIEQLLRDPSHAAKLGQAGRLKALEQHDVQQEALSINALYREVLGLSCQARPDNNARNRSSDGIEVGAHSAQ